MISAARLPTAPLLSSRPPAKRESERRARETERKREREGREKQRERWCQLVLSQILFNQPVLLLCFEQGGGVPFRVNVLLRNRRSTTNTRQRKRTIASFQPRVGAPRSELTSSTETPLLDLGTPQFIISLTEGVSLGDEPLNKRHTG